MAGHIYIYIVNAGMLATVCVPKHEKSYIMQSWQAKALGLCLSRSPKILIYIDQSVSRDAALREAFLLRNRFARERRYTLQT